MTRKQYPSVLVMLGIAATILSGGCAQYDQMVMRRQAKVKVFEEDPFSSEKSSARLPVPGTVPQSYSSAPEILSKRKIGQNRYRTFCSPCHGLRGRGDGLVLKHGYDVVPLSFEHQRLKTAPSTYFRDVALNGIKSMFSYSDVLSRAEADAIAEVIKANDYGENLP